MKTEIEKILTENWRAVEQEDDDCFSVIVVEKKPSIGTMYVCERICQGEDNGKAHAKLIAAAPDMLEALLKLTDIYLREYKNEWELPDYWKEVKAALNKATE